MFAIISEVTLGQVLKKNNARLYKAGAGENSHVHRLVGEAGSDVVIPVPTGITVYSQTGVKIGRKLTQNKTLFNFKDNNITLFRRIE